MGANRVRIPRIKEGQNGFIGSFSEPRDGGRQKATAPQGFEALSFLDRKLSTEVLTPPNAGRFQTLQPGYEHRKAEAESKRGMNTIMNNYLRSHPNDMIIGERLRQDSGGLSLGGVPEILSGVVPRATIREFLPNRIITDTIIEHPDFIQWLQYLQARGWI